jgi:hypothetical protein
MNFRVLFLLVITLFLTACASVQKKDSLTVKEKEVVKVRVPDELLTPCVPERPLSKEDYLSKSFPERETYLTDYSVSLLKTIKECNVKLDRIREFNKQ